jgi:hypothetical protein
MILAKGRMNGAPVMIGGVGLRSIVAAGRLRVMQTSLTSMALYELVPRYVSFDKVISQSGR